MSDWLSSQMVCASGQEQDLTLPPLHVVLHQVRSYKHAMGTRHLSLLLLKLPQFSEQSMRIESTFQGGCSYSLFSLSTLLFVSLD